MARPKNKRIYRGLKQHGQAALRLHAVSRAENARDRYGPEMTREAIDAMLADNEICRYRVTLAFDAAPIEDGYFAEAVRVEDGFRLCIHPVFADDADAIAHIVGLHLPAPNYGKMVSSADAEAFGATLLGLSDEQFHADLWALAERLP